MILKHTFGFKLPSKLNSGCWSCELEGLLPERPSKGALNGYFEKENTWLRRNDAMSKDRIILGRLDQIKSDSTY